MNLCRCVDDKMQAFIDKGIEPFGRSYDVTHHAQEL